MLRLEAQIAARQVVVVGVDIGRVARDDIEGAVDPFEKVGHADFDCDV